MVIKKISLSTLNIEINNIKDKITSDNSEAISLINNSIDKENETLKEIAKLSESGLFNGWSVTTSSLIIRTDAPRSVGTLSDTILFGGVEYEMPATESFNGNTWNSINAVMSQPHTKCAVIGVDTSSVLVVAGGAVDSPDIYTWTCEVYNGTLWKVTDKNLPNGRVGGNSGAGTFNSGLSLGGTTSSMSILNSTYKFDGTTWTSLSNMIMKRHSHVSVGSFDAVFAGSGLGTSSNAGCTFETFNGTTWSNIDSADRTNTNNTKNAAMTGTLNDALFMGGSLSSATDVTIGFNGSTWKNLKPMPGKRMNHAASGDAKGTIIAQGEGVTSTYYSDSYRYMSV